MATKAKFAITSLDKRRWRRLHFTVPVRVTIDDKSRHISVINSRCYMNAGGIAFIADTDLAIGDEAEIALTDYDLTLRGVVLNRAGNQYGVKFVASSAEEAEQLGFFRQILRSKVGHLGACELTTGEMHRKSMANPAKPLVDSRFRGSSRSRSMQIARIILCLIAIALALLIWRAANR